MIDPRVPRHYDPAMRIPRLASLLLAFTLPSTTACKSAGGGADDEIEAQPVEAEQFAAEAAATVCAQLFSCSCGDNLSTEPVEPLPWADEAACVAEKQPEFQQLLDDLLASGGTFSPECGGEFIAGFERLRCDSAYDYVAGGGSYYSGWRCPLVVHEQPVGATCVVDYVGRNFDCGLGKVCSSETQTCVEIGPLPVGEGGLCEVGYVSLPCAEGLECDYVDGQPICVAARELGEACPDYDCHSGELVCDPNALVCSAPAALGESCELIACGPGLYCDGGKDLTCQAEFEPGHGCASDSVCAAGGSCINNVCVAAPPAICYQL